MDKELAYFLRNHFEEGMLLKASDLSNLQIYMDGKRRLTHHAILGNGVVCGLRVESLGDSIRIHSGLAIDSGGNEIYLPNPVTMRLEELFEGGVIDPKKRNLCIFYAEEASGEAFVIRNEPIRKAVHNRVVEKFKVLAQLDKSKSDICIARLTFSELELKLTGAVSPIDGFSFSPLWEELLKRDIRSRSGTVDFGLLESDQTYFSKELEHGFGKGADIHITLSLMDRQYACQHIYQGDAALFKMPVRLASDLLREQGRFIIAVETTKPIHKPIIVRWRAEVR